MTLFALVSAYPTETEARAAFAEPPQVPYKGIWRTPEPYGGIVHLFSDLTHDELEDAGLVDMFDELSETYPGSGIYE
jgi:hypothetical protein